METQFTISSIIFIVWLIVPGVIFKRFYYQGQFTKQFGAGLFADRLITSIFWGVFVQIITFLIYSHLFGFTILSIKKYVDGAYTDLKKDLMPSVLYEYLIYILGYLVSFIVMAAFSGMVLHKIVRLFKIDVHFNVLRFSNQWDYYFRGDILATRDFKGSKKGKVLSTMVDMLIDDATEKNKLVSGFLTQYNISPKTGELETIHLTGAQKYSETEKRFKDIPGDCFIIPFSRIINLNLRYNIQVVDNDKKKKAIFSLISAIGLLGLLFLIIFPWYLKISLGYKLLGILFSLISGLLLIAICANPFQANAQSKLNEKSFWSSFITMLVFGIIALFFLNLLPSIDQIRHIFK
ncbi:hypothetical protein KXD93_16670 [Mucilaginibacter sp. BJC16-A38]|uniref:hypothetical protein n=1 Tax=Mucilaginibacter phenanthrenivorans TaxID=1234842 RepID=UPI002157A970|nr:hypothetical protein [Mucilaginibacter phenanthrenivorans]MCR8559293.1 hypothetical protein [Mucilaginibacter phenanthrenivorans]